MFQQSLYGLFHGWACRVLRDAGHAHIHHQCTYLLRWFVLRCVHVACFWVCSFATFVLWDILALISMYWAYYQTLWYCFQPAVFKYSVTSAPWCGCNLVTVHTQGHTYQWSVL